MYSSRVIDTQIAKHANYNITRQSISIQHVTFRVSYTHQQISSKQLSALHVATVMQSQIQTINQTPSKLHLCTCILNPLSSPTFNQKRSTIICLHVAAMMQYTIRLSHTITLHIPNYILVHILITYFQPKTFKHIARMSLL